MAKKRKSAAFARLDAVISGARREGYPPSIAINVIANEARSSARVVYQKSFGPKYKYYDVGSLTKVLVTTPLVMQLFENNRLKLSERAEESLGFLSGTRVGKITIKQLLSHSSGLTWWRPYYEKLRKIPLSERRAALETIFKKEKVSPVRKCVYSDLDFILLGWIVERKLGMPLDEAAALYIFKPLGLRDTFFIKATEAGAGRAMKLPSKSKFAPTEKHAFRGVLQRAVFDDNAWSMGGVSGHAGLFSTLDDVSRLGAEFQKTYQGRSKKLFKTSTARLFFKRAVPAKLGDWALGFTVPSRPVSTGGRLVSTNAAGHTGYTGTSLWIDLKRQTIVTILSNRTFPTRKDERFLELRKQIHDVVWEIIDGN